LTRIETKRAAEYMTCHTKMDEEKVRNR